MNHRQKLADAVLRPINVASVLMLGLYTLLWGFWVANPWWSVFNSAALFGFMQALAPEAFWGCVALFCGAVITYGAVKRRYRPLTIGAGTSFAHWLMIAIFYALGDPLNTGAITSLVFALYSAFLYLNLRVNFKDDKKSRYLLDPPLN
jgi:hypothetical protein